MKKLFGDRLFKAWGLTGVEGGVRKGEPHMTPTDHEGDQPACVVLRGVRSGSVCGENR